MNFLLSLIIILFPSIIGYTSGMLCNVKKSSGSNVNFRPDPKVFGIAWAIRYILLGFSFWFAVNSLNPLLSIAFYILLNLALCSWLYFYSCKNKKIIGIYALIISIMFALMCYTVGNTVSKLLIVPLICWLLFATLINVKEVENI